jgi:hypothetical protein
MKPELPLQALTGRIINRRCGDEVIGIPTEGDPTSVGIYVGAFKEVGLDIGEEGLRLALALIGE